MVQSNNLNLFGKLYIFLSMYECMYIVIQNIDGGQQINVEWLDGLGNLSSVQHLSYGVNIFQECLFVLIIVTSKIFMCIGKLIYVIVLIHIHTTSTFSIQLIFSFCERKMYNILGIENKGERLIVDVHWKNSVIDSYLKHHDKINMKINIFKMFQVFRRYIFIS